MSEQNQNQKEKDKKVKMYLRDCYSSINSNISRSIYLVFNNK